MKGRLTDDVRSLRVVRELVLVLVFTVLVERALVAGLQNPLQKLEAVQAGAQAVDPQSLLVALDGPANVRFAYGPEIHQSGHRRNGMRRLGGPLSYRRTGARPAFSECPEACAPPEGCHTPVTRSSPAGPHRRWDPLESNIIADKGVRGSRRAVNDSFTPPPTLAMAWKFLHIRSVLPFHAPSSNIKDEFKRVCGSSAWYSRPHSALFLGPVLHSPFSSGRLESANEQLDSELLFFIPV